MQFLNLLSRTLMLSLAVVVFAACGDVGDAPQAQTGDAVAISGTQGETFAIDTTRSEVTWRAAKVTRAHDGGFRLFNGSVTVNEGEVTGVQFNIDTRSIWSDTDRLTNHLMSEDFFHVENYPTATFESAEIAPIDSADATHLVTGNLTMHGQTNGVTFPAAIAVDDGAIRATADFIIDRTDWGITYTGQADDLIENDVRLMFDVVATAETPIAEVDSD